MIYGTSRRSLHKRSNINEEYLEQHIFLWCKWANHNSDVISYHNDLKKRRKTNDVNLACVSGSKKGKGRGAGRGGGGGGRKKRRRKGGRSPTSSLHYRYRKIGKETRDNKTKQIGYFALECNIWCLSKLKLMSRLPVVLLGILVSRTPFSTLSCQSK